MICASDASFADNSLDRKKLARVHYDAIRRSNSVESHASLRFNNVLWPDLYDELALGDVWREQRAVRVKENTRIGQPPTSRIQ
jgi:hypothetical protein